MILNLGVVLGKRALIKEKKEGDKSTPCGTFKIGDVYYRPDRVQKPQANLKCKKIERYMGWCNDTSSKFYNNKIKINKKIKHEKLFRSDYKYNYLVIIHYNHPNPILGAGSAIFIHLTKDYTPTAGCIGLKKKDLLILIKLIDRKTKIKIS